jgi:selenocysteine lyase/cysteine desulfurase
MRVLGLDPGTTKGNPVGVALVTGWPSPRLLGTAHLAPAAGDTLAEFLGATADEIAFGANMTTMTFAFTRAVARTLQPGDRVVGTRLDHDANVSPWRIACEESGAEHLLTPFSTVDGRLDMDALTALITPNTKWVAVTGASNLIGTMPDVKAVVALAHRVGARVFVDAVHLAPHMPVSVRDLGCDVLATSPYKWYGPHAGVLCIEPNLLNVCDTKSPTPFRNDDLKPSNVFKLLVDMSRMML